MNESQRGGALELSDPETHLLIQNSTLLSNKAEYEGSDMLLTNTEQVRIANCRISSNTPKDSDSVPSIYYKGIRNGENVSIPIHFWNTIFTAPNRTITSNSGNFSHEVLADKYIATNGASLDIQDTYYASGKFHRNVDHPR